MKKLDQNFEVECSGVFAFELNVTKRPTRQMFAFILIRQQGANTDTHATLKEPVQLDPEGDPEKPLRHYANLLFNLRSLSLFFFPR